MANVEEMLEGYEWAAGNFVGSWKGTEGKRGAADQIEARLLKELKALEMVAFCTNPENAPTHHI